MSTSTAVLVSLGLIAAAAYYSSQVEARLIEAASRTPTERAFGAAGDLLGDLWSAVG